MATVSSRPAYSRGDPRDAPPIHERFDQFLERMGAGVLDREALVYLPDRGAPALRLSYRELLEQVAIAAGALVQNGIVRGDIVAVFGPNRPETVILMFACARTGVALVPVGAQTPAPELDYIIQTTGAKALFYAPFFKGQELGEIARDAASRCQTLKQLVALEPDGEACVWEKWLEAGNSHMIANDDGGGQPDDFSLILFTSGTTGKPKAVPHTSAALANEGRATASRAELEQGCRYLHAMPFFHVGGTVTAMASLIAVAGTHLFMPAFSPAAMAAAIEAEKVTAILAVPTMLVSLAEAAERQGADFPFLKTVMTGGSLVPQIVAERWISKWRVGISNTYGMTELGGPVLQTAPSHPLHRALQSVGTPLANIEVEIVDISTRNRVEIGVEGELQFRSPWMMRGYLRNDAIDRSIFTHDGWLPSGDLGVMDADGFVRITGRAKDLIIRGGENISPAEIEDKIRECLDDVISDVCVVGVPDEYYGEEVAAFVRLHDGVSMQEEALASRLAGKLATHKIPAHWVFLKEFPVTASGKIQRFRLPTIFQEQTTGNAADRQP